MSWGMRVMERMGVEGDIGIAGGGSVGSIGDGIPA